MDMGMQHGHGHAAWTWPCSMDMDLQHGYGNSMDLDMDMQLGHGNAAWTSTCCMSEFTSMLLSMPRGMDVYTAGLHVHSACLFPMSILHSHVHAICPCLWRMSMSMLHGMDLQH